MTTPLQLPVLSYRLAQVDDTEDVTLERVPQMTGPDHWAIREGHYCLNKSALWESEPIPSSRNDDFFARCRWPSAEEALEFWEVHGRTKFPLRWVAQAGKAAGDG